MSDEAKIILKDMQIKEMRKELINQDKYIGKLKEEYANQLQQKENIIKEVRKYIEKYDFITGYYEYNYDDENDTYTHYTVKEELLEILDKGE